MIWILSSLCSHAASLCRICPITSIIKIDLLLQMKGLTRARTGTHIIFPAAPWSPNHHKQAFSGTVSNRAKSLIQVPGQETSSQLLLTRRRSEIHPPKVSFFQKKH